MKINLIFPHQLFKDSPLPKDSDLWILIEEELFFKQYPFHKQKIAFHRASMLNYKDYLCSLRYDVKYISASEESSDTRHLIQQHLSDEIHLIDPVDDWLSQKWSKHTNVKVYDNPSFIESDILNHPFFKDRKTYFHHHFYQEQRKRHNILMSAGKPIGGKWSFDEDNRKKYPKGKMVPAIYFPELNELTREAIESTEKDFPDNYGELKQFIYPVTFVEAENWLNQFLDYRMLEFGTFEDAIVREESILHHSLLSPLINVGLLTPNQVLEAVLKRSGEYPMNSTEGFIRQIIGWREFIRGMYVKEGRRQRTSNFWEFERDIPASFYDGTTGILPIDETIKKVLKTGYCHHIERLMVLGNFMMLCEFKPNQVYQWFMELFIDAYDWVMVPNVYGMSQFSDGGLMTTKPYLSGSNYILKMSNYKKGDWCAVWDALYWRFIDKRRDFFEQNFRLKMMVRMWDKKGPVKQEELLKTAESFLASLGK